jgi:hypothetical protein
MTDELDPQRLRRLLDAVAQLPRAAEPARDAWPTIRDRIDARRVRPIGPESSHPTTARQRRAPWVAAAAVLLIIASSGLTALLLRGRAAVPVASAPRDMPSAVAESASAPVLVPPTLVLPAAGLPIDPVFSRYDAAAADLAADLRERRARLDPGTIAVLDSCLKRIDAAIAEARAALRADPGNSVVTELLTVSYQQKLDLLKRATDLPLGSH